MGQQCRYSNTDAYAILPARCPLLHPCIYIFICYTFNILFIYTNGSFKDHGYTSLKKAVVKSNRQKTHTRHALSYFLGLLENLIEVRL